jgi:hypothetical protein
VITLLQGPDKQREDIGFGAAKELVMTFGNRSICLFHGTCTHNAYLSLDMGLLKK